MSLFLECLIQGEGMWQKLGLEADNLSLFWFVWFVYNDSISH